MRFVLSKYNGGSALELAKAEDFVNISFDGSTKASIDQIELPLSNVDLLNVENDDESEWALTMGSRMAQVTPTVDPTTESTVNMRKVEYNSVQDVENEINRMLIEAQKTWYSEHYPGLVFSATVSPEPIDTNANKNRIFTVPNANNGGTACHAKVVISGFFGFPPNQQALVNVRLINPNGDSALVISGLLLETGKTATFEMNGVPIPHDRVLDSNTTYMPMENFGKLFNTSSAGDWIVNFEACNGKEIDDVSPPHFITGTTVLTLEIIQALNGTTAEKYKFPSLPTQIGFNSNHHIEYILPERFVESGLYFKFGKKLANIMSLESKTTTSFFPRNSVLGSPIEVISEADKRYHLSQVATIEAISHYLPIVDRDVFIGDIKSDAFASFTLTGEIDTSARFSFTGGVHNSREYTITEGMSVKKIDIALRVVYKDGSTKDLFLSPGEHFKCILNFRSTPRLDDQ